MSGNESLLAARLRFWRFAAWALRLDDVPWSCGDGKPRWGYRPTLAILRRRYDTAELVGGRDLARQYDYIPF